MKRYGSGMWTTIYPEMSSVCSQRAREHKIVIDAASRARALPDNREAVIKRMEKMIDDYLKVAK